MTRISSRDIANQFIENPKLTKLKRFYVYTMIGKKNVGYLIYEILMVHKDLY